MHNYKINRECAMRLDIEQIVKSAQDKGASDIHLSPLCPLMVRIDGDMVPVTEERLRPEDIAELAESVVGERRWKELEEKGEVDCAYSVEGLARMRVNVFRQRGTYAMALRMLAVSVPSLEELGIPRSVLGLTEKKRGLVLVTGATGSGKSTTLAALINIIAKKYPKHIITLEDPIEYLHNHSMSAVVQREIGDDSLSYANALRAALRQDPDVILVGEMRDLETISTAITAAETGHLVFSTLHTNSAAATIDRVIDVFPPYQQQQIRVQLANVIEGVIAQQLLPKQGSHGRVAAFEIMLSNPAIRNMIREGKTHQIQSVLQTSKRAGMQTMDDCLVDLYMQRKISAETAVLFAHEIAAVKERVMFK